MTTGEVPPYLINYSNYGLLIRVWHYSESPVLILFASFLNLKFTFWIPSEFHPFAPLLWLLSTKRFLHRAMAFLIQSLHQRMLMHFRYKSWNILKPSRSNGCQLWCTDVRTCCPWPLLALWWWFSQSVFLSSSVFLILWSAWKPL